jgi:TRAP-type C4-dicarboxylate transport system permease small subunit
MALIKKLQRAQLVLAGILLFVFLVTVVYQIITRHMGISVPWTEDVSQYSFVWAVFMGASAMILEQQHFSFVSFRDSLKSEKARAALLMAVNIVICFFCILMLYYGIQIARQFWNYTWINLPNLKRGPVWLCLPIAGTLGGVYAITLVVHYAKTVFGSEPLNQEFVEGGGI